MLDYGTWSVLTHNISEMNSIRGFRGWIAKDNIVWGIVMQSKLILSA